MLSYLKLFFGFTQATSFEIPYVQIASGGADICPEKPSDSRPAGSAEGGAQVRRIGGIDGNDCQGGQSRYQ